MRKKRPEKASQAFNRGQAALSRFDWSAAAAYFKRAQTEVKNKDDLFGAYLNGATAEMRLARFSKARLLVRKALALGIEYDQRYFGAAVVEANSGAPSSAKEILERLLAVCPDDSIAWALMAFVNEQLGSPESAIQAAEHALEFEVAFDGEVRCAAARAYVAMGNYSRAEELYAEVIQGPSHGQAVVETTVHPVATAFAGLGRLRLIQGRGSLSDSFEQEALSFFQKATVIAPGHEDAWANLAELAMERGSFQTAADAAAKALELLRMPDVLLLRIQGSAFSNLRMFEEAQRCLDQARRASAKDELVGVVRDEMLNFARQHKWSDTVKLCEELEALQSYPDPIELNTKAGALHQLGKSAEALKTLQLACQTAPNDPIILVNYGFARWHDAADDAGRKEGLEQILEGLALKPRYPEAWAKGCHAFLVEKRLDKHNELRDQALEILGSDPYLSGVFHDMLHLSTIDMLSSFGESSLGGIKITLNRETTMSTNATAAEQPSGATVPRTTPHARRILAVGTEWESRHGGLSTFNRDLCTALAAAGHDVVCLVPEASDTERTAAAGAHVRLVTPAVQPGLVGTEVLLLDTPLPADFTPQLVIGHDRKTGPHATALARRFAGSKLIILIHTRPEDIEWHKDKLGGDDAAITTEQRKDLQQKLAAGADLLVGVGPRLADAAATHIYLMDSKPPVHRLDPGFHAVRRPSSLPPEIHCLLLGRAEDATLKGLDIAARALGSVAKRSRLTTPPRLIVRGAPSGTGKDLRKSLVDFAKFQLDIEVRPYSPDVEQLQRDILASSLVLMPSRCEGFGLVGLEAIAAGTPVLVSDQSGLGDLLRERLGKLAEPAIVATHSKLNKAAPEWERAIESVLLDRHAAFTRAATLRQALAIELTWPEAIRRLEAAWSRLFADLPPAA